MGAAALLAGIFAAHQAADSIPRLNQVARTARNNVVYGSNRSPLERSENSREQGVRLAQAA